MNDPWLLSWTKKKKIEPKPLQSCLIPLLLIAVTYHELDIFNSDCPVSPALIPVIHRQVRTKSILVYSLTWVQVTSTLGRGVSYVLRFQSWRESWCYLKKSFSDAIYHFFIFFDRFERKMSGVKRNNQ